MQVISRSFQYAQGLWTPSDINSAFGFTIIAARCTWKRIGNKLFYQATITTPAMASAAQFGVKGFPFACATENSMPIISSGINDALCNFQPGQTTCLFYKTALVAASYIDMQNSVIYMNGQYDIS